MMAKVCVCVPTYNQAQYIAETIESIRAQSFKDFELYVINGASTDDTEGVLRKYQPHITKYIKTEFNHLGDKVNIAYHLTRAPLLTWLASDDIWKPDYLKTAVEVLEREHGDLVYSNFDHCSEDLVPVRTRTLEPFKNYDTMYRLNKEKGENCVEIFLLFTRQLFLEVGDFNSEPGEEFEFALRAAYLKKRLVHNPASLAICRYHARRASCTLDMDAVRENLYKLHDTWKQKREATK